MAAAFDATDAGVETSSHELLFDEREASEVAQERPAQRPPRRRLGGGAGRLAAAAALVAAGAAAAALSSRRRGDFGSLRADVPGAVGLQAALAGMSVCGAIYCNLTGTCCADALCCGPGAECCTGSAGGGTICCDQGAVCCNGICCGPDAVCCKNGIVGRAQGAVCGAAGSVCHNGIVLGPSGGSNQTPSSTFCPTPSPTAAVPSGYIIAYSDAWCGDAPLYDATHDSADSMVYTTADSCAQKCADNPSCRFFVWGWNPSGYYRCATFTTCNDRHGYIDGCPNVYEKQTGTTSPEENTTAE